MADKEHNAHADSHDAGSHAGAPHPGAGHGHAGGGGGHAEGEHEGAPEWLISFADNVALMMGFFVILLAMNMGPKGGGTTDSPNSSDGPQAAMMDIILSIREGFNNPVSLDSKDPDDLPLIRRLKERLSHGESSANTPDGDSHDQQAIRPTDFTEITGLVPFEEGQSTLSQSGLKTCRDVAAYLKGRKWIIEVRGHASASEAFQNEERGMRLSYQRSLAVAQALVAAGLTWEQLRLVSCSDNDRVKPVTYDKFGQRANQRAEIVVTNYPLADDPFLKEPASVADEPADSESHAPDPQSSDGP